MYVRIVSLTTLMIYMTDCLEMFWSKEEVFCVVGWVDMGLYICGPSYCYGRFACCVYLILFVFLDNF